MPITTKNISEALIDELQLVEQSSLPVSVAGVGRLIYKQDGLYIVTSSGVTIGPLGNDTFVTNIETTNVNTTNVNTTNVTTTSLITNVVTTNIVLSDPTPEPGKGSFYNKGNKPYFGGDDGNVYMLAGRQFIFTVDGTLVQVTGKLKIPNLLGITLSISKVALIINTAPTGQAIIVDIHKNGTTIFTNQANRPQIAATATSGNTTTIDVATWADGEYLTMDVDQVGSSVAGSDLTVVIITG